MIEISRFVTCSLISRRSPHTLYHVRRKWPEPPRKFGVYLEFHRLNEAEAFSWRLRVWRGKRMIDETVEYLELAGTPHVEHVSMLSLRYVEFKTYRLEILINNRSTASTMLDFGAEDASP